jgi:DNA-binding NtrC family response regulator
MSEASASHDTILVVDDDVIVRMSIAEYLRHCGYRVIQAVSITEARQVLNDQRIKVDVVFADLHSPSSGDTFTLAQWVRQERPEVDVVLAGSIKGAAKAAAEVCEEGPLVKPFEPQTLVERIRRLKAARQRNQPQPNSKER